MMTIEKMTKVMVEGVVSLVFGQVSYFFLPFNFYYDEQRKVVESYGRGCIRTVSYFFLPLSYYYDEQKEEDEGYGG